MPDPEIIAVDGPVILGDLLRAVVPDTLAALPEGWRLTNEVPTPLDSLREALDALTIGDINDLGGLASQYPAVYRMHAVYHAARAALAALRGE